MSAAPDWEFWLHLPQIELWQAPALSLGIDPDSLEFTRDGWMAGGGMNDGPFIEEDSFPSIEAHTQYKKRLRLLRAHSSDQAYFQPGDLNMSRWYRGTVRLEDFATWAVNTVKWPNLPPPLAALATKKTNNEKAPVDHMKSGNGEIRELTQERAEEWLRMPWSIGEVHLLLNGWDPVGKLADDCPPPANAGDDVKRLHRAIATGALVSIRKDEGEPLYSPAEVIRLCEKLDFGSWSVWKAILEQSPTGGDATTERTDWSLLSEEDKKTAWKVMSPAERRDKALDLVKKHNGNKTAAGKEAGVSRNRIAELIRAVEPAGPATGRAPSGKRKPPFRSSPFGLPEPKPRKASR